MLVKCPYCKQNIDVDDFNMEHMDQDNIIENYECNNCDKEFDIYVEFIPSGSAIKIVYTKCECCGKEVKRRNLHVRGNVFPFPDNKYSILCNKCYIEFMHKQLEEEEKNNK